MVTPSPYLTAKVNVKKNNKISNTFLVQLMIKSGPYVEKLIDKYKKILSISEEPINVACSIIDMPNQAEIFWDKSSKTWFLSHNVDVVKFVFAHELGHIYFAKKKAKYIYFASLGEKDPEIDDRLYPLLNNLLNCFINYNLTLFDEFYPLYRAAVFEYLDKIEVFKERINKAKDPMVLLSWYFLFFLDYNFLVKKPEREEISNETTQLMSHLKNSLLQCSSVIDELILNNITEKLKSFDNIKSTNDPKIIINFFIDVLQATTLWDESKLIKQVKLIYPKGEF